MRKRLYSYSSVSMSISSRYRRYRYSHYRNTLTVPNADPYITPTMSRDVSQLSLSRPLTSGKFSGGNMSRDASILSFFERLSHVRSKLPSLPSLDISREPSQYSLSLPTPSIVKRQPSTVQLRDSSDISVRNASVPAVDYAIPTKRLIPSTSKPKNNNLCKNPTEQLRKFIKSQMIFDDGY